MACYVWGLLGWPRESGWWDANVRCEWLLRFPRAERERLTAGRGVFLWNAYRFCEGARDRRESGGEVWEKVGFLEEGVVRAGC